MKEDTASPVACGPVDLRRISACTPTQGSRFELEGLSGSLALNMKCTVSWAVSQLKAKCLSFPLKACQISADWTNYRNRDHTVTTRRRATAASLPQGSAASQHIKQNTIQKQKENRKVYCLSFKYGFLLQHTPGACLPSSLSPCRDRHHHHPKVTTDQIKTEVTKTQEERSCRMLQLLTSKKQTSSTVKFIWVSTKGKTWEKHR